ncbi:membrane-bound O-acyltransferase family protein, partial [Candidatus Marinamargulisbacteria bacterium SCGC AAA071-K20]
EQLKKLKIKNVDMSGFSYGIWFFVMGLSKKVLIADKVGPIANRLFEGVGPFQFGESWAGVLAYTTQLYFDFSGYSDMAIGLGLMLGFKFPINFLSPYKSRSISEFWGRWHITFSHFLRDYLYIPLSGNKRGILKTIRNLVIVMFLGGLWHGAQFNFILWGLYHGLLLSINHIFRNLNKVSLPAPFLTLITFIFVMFGWVIFRAPSLSIMKAIFKGMVGLTGVENLFGFGITSRTFGQLPNFVDIFGGPNKIGFLIIGLCIIFLAKNTHEIKPSMNGKWATIIGLLFVASLSCLGQDTPFIYFQF